MKQENIGEIIAAELKIKPFQTKAVIELLDDGNTIPFISRYRKEQTGELDEEKVRIISERLTYLRNFVKRQEEIISKIEEQGKMTDELLAAIEKTSKLQELEDIYLPYKQKKRTRAQKAKEKGLEPLANTIMLQQLTTGNPLDMAAEYINAELEVETAEDALSGAQDIIAEMISEEAQLRQELRKYLWNNALLATTLDEEKEATEEGKVFLMYKEYSELVRTLPSHRILAINRGEKLECLKVKLEIDDDKINQIIQKRFITQPSIFTEILQNTIADSWKRLIQPSLEREIRNQLTETAEKQAISIFGTNLRQLLMQAPLAGFTVMGLDPGYRTGCKMAIVDATGNVLDHGVLYITHGDKGAAESAKKALALIKKYHVNLISIG
ncbi:MAG: RNA-binding transcriptional accessory protein, partial [Anaerovibrio sp.]|nr:RNA-binding transcriptional accessory protein [Anaerovibrio sp.]